MTKRIPTRHMLRTRKQISEPSETKVDFQTSILGLTKAALKITRPASLLLFVYAVDNAPSPGSTNLVKVLSHNIRVEERMKIRNSNIHVTYQESGINSDKGSCCETFTCRCSTVYHKYILLPAINGIYGLFKCFSWAWFATLRVANHAQE